MNYEQIITEAHAAATKAMADYKAKWRAQLSPDQLAHVDRNFCGEPPMCGFAWVKVSGNDPLARFCRKQGGNRKYGAKGYPIGWEFWGPGEYNGQSVDVKTAGAHAFRDVLASYGISADVGSRLD